MTTAVARHVHRNRGLSAACCRETREAATYPWLTARSNFRGGIVGIADFPYVEAFLAAGLMYWMINTVLLLGQNACELPRGKGVLIMAEFVVEVHGVRKSFCPRTPAG